MSIELTVKYLNYNGPIFYVDLVRNCMKKIKGTLMKEQEINDIQ